MIDKKEFARIKDELAKFEEHREEVIALSRDIIKVSKQIIYGIHRSDVDQKLLKEIKEMIKKLPKERYDTGMGEVAAQEYVEALCLYNFSQGKPLQTAKELGVDSEAYLLGLCDLSGELVRKAVNAVIKGDIAQAQKIQEAVEQLYGDFLQLDLRNGELRKKSDQIKWNLNKIQDLLYDAHMKGKKA